MASLTQINPAVTDTLPLNLGEVWMVDKSIYNKTFRPYIPDSFVLKDAVLEIIDRINQASAQSLSGKLSLTAHPPWMKQGSNLHFYEQYCGVPARPFCLSKQAAQNTWLNKVLNALKETSHIKNYHRADDTGYEITL